MNSFERPDSWYEPDVYPQWEKEECKDCKMREGDYYDISKAVQSLIAHLYTGTDKLDIGMIDDAIGTICDAVGVKMPSGLIKIQRQETEIYKFARALNL